MPWSLPDSHPRVFFRPEDLPLFRKRAATTHQREMKALLHSATELTKLPEPAQCNNLALRLAFLYQLSGEGKHAALAARCLEESLQLGVDPNYGAGSFRLKTLACCYDWLHGQLPGDLRERVGRRALDQSQALYNSEEVDPQTFLAGHAINQIPYILMAGMAVGNDFGADIPPVARPLVVGSHTHEAPEYINDVLYRIENKFACYKHFMDGHSFSQSYAYSLAYIGEIPYLLQLMENLGLPGFKQHAWFENIVEWYTYALRQDETFIRYGDYFCSNSIFTSGYMYRPMAAVASRYKNRIARWWTDKFTLDGVEPDAFIFDDRNGVEAQSPETLPRTRFFPPMGISIARGDFNKGTVAAFKCSPLYLHNHCHRDQNQITIYHKGELAIDSGAYDGYESPHWKNYYTRTIAHNTLVVHDPDEKPYMRAWALANDGGQRQVNIPDFTPRRFADISKACYQDGKILGYREGPGFSYVCGDASNCYRPEKLKRYVRHVVSLLDWPHLGAVALVVLDEVTLARPGLLPRILLHTVNEPAVDGTRVTAAHGEGRLEMHVLEPNGHKIEKIGGPGHECWVDGQNFPVDFNADENLSTRAKWHTPGEWRVEVAPGEPCIDTEFLTVWIPSDASVKNVPQPVLQAHKSGRVVKLGARSIGLFKTGSGAKLEGKESITIELF
jgi:heparin/heparan-sulfate lyase